MKTIYVFDDFSGDTPVHMGNLYVPSRATAREGFFMPFLKAQKYLAQNE